MIKKSFVIAVLFALVALSSLSWAQSPADLNDLEIAHVAYTADNIDIRYAHLALAISSNPKVRAFAETMIRDHTAVNKRQGRWRRRGGNRRQVDSRRLLSRFETFRFIISKSKELRT